MTPLSLHYVVLASTLLSVTAFQNHPIPKPLLPSSPGTPLFSTAEISSSASTTTPPLLSRDRYIASNRFQVRTNKEAKFEQRWTQRKSRLASLDGFRYFHLMRRVSLDSSADPLPGRFGNYVSFTVWQNKENFDAWRKGDAFKEAHGGTSIASFLKTMVSSAFVLKGAPKPAFYDGLLVQSIVPETRQDIVNGWRTLEADGISCLPTECFVACNQFFVPPNNAVAFEQRWAQRESRLKECEGFVAFTMMRRSSGGGGGMHGDSGVVEGEEPTYVSTTIWKDREAFQKWREGQSFKVAHGQKAGEENKPLWTQPPTPVFYEGVLVISSEQGA